MQKEKQSNQLKKIKQNNKKTKIIFNKETQFDFSETENGHKMRQKDDKQLIGRFTWT